jgi:RHS repeat-associated protein
VDAGTNGTVYFDDFESRRFSYIGTLTDPGVDDPQATNPAGWFARTYAYSASIPHAVTSVNPETGSPDTYEYDLNGNMTCRIENGVTYTHAYNAENRASSIAKRTGDCATGTILESWSFAYDGDGNRVTTAHFTGTQGTPDSTTSYFMGGAYEVKDGAAKKYYSIAGMMVATQDASGLQYLLTDHLGSVVAVTNSSGTLTSQQRYLPFGGARSIPNSPILGTDFGYTGQRMLDEDMGGIIDYKARFYSPALGRFVQPDSIIPNPANPQAFNRFGYVINNPTNHIDPTGHQYQLLYYAMPIVFVVAVTILIYNTPQMRELGENVLEMGGNRVTREKRKLEELSNYLDSVAPENQSWHGDNSKDPCKGVTGKFYCIGRVVTAICTAFCPPLAKNVSAEDEESPVTSTPDPTSAAAATGSCPPPYNPNSCPGTQIAMSPSTATGTPTPTMTTTSTNTATLTVTSTSTGTPNFTQTPTPPSYRRRLSNGLMVE